jgi:hypothetical protein
MMAILVYTRAFRNSSTPSRLMLTSQMVQKGPSLAALLLSIISTQPLMPPGTPSSWRSSRKWVVKEVSAMVSQYFACNALNLKLIE